MQGLIAAIRWMTVIPIPKHIQTHHDLKLAVPWMPGIGLLIGVLLMASTWAGSFIDPWLGALFGLTIWFVVTGFLHADGLADLADALGASHQNVDQKRFLEVLKDPHIGSFGVMSLVMLVVSKLVLLMLLAKAEAWLVLLLIPVWSRLASIVWMSLPSLSDGSASMMSSALPSHQFIWSCGAVLWSLSLMLVDGLWLAPLIVWLWYVFLRDWIGGMNGDCLGAGIELTEVGMLILCLFFI
ncbi:MAG: adenosylcobinamide-GDP ribazoletransferase [Mariprofundaceae bacterium]